MNYKVSLIASLCLFASAHAYSDSFESTRSPGWYAGISTSVVNMGGSVLTTSRWGSDETYDADTTDDQLTLKAGYITENENRVEFYYKDDAVDVDDSEVGAFKTSTLGVNYQWGLSSLSSEKMIPYLRVGAGLARISHTLE